jgi:hypothetical protein
MRIEVLMAVKINIMDSWIMTPGSLVGEYQHLRWTYCPCPEDGPTTYQTKQARIPQYEVNIALMYSKWLSIWNL